MTGTAHSDLVDSGKSEPHPFHKWLGDRWKRVAVFFTTPVIAASAELIAKWLEKVNVTLTTKGVIVAVFVFQAALCVVFWCFTPKASEAPAFINGALLSRAEHVEALRRANRFRWWWLVLWLGFAALYACWAVDAVYELESTGSKPNGWVQLVANIFINLTNAFVIIAYLTLSEAAAKKDPDLVGKDSDLRERSTDPVWEQFKGWGVFLIFVTFGDALLIFWLQHLLNVSRGKPTEEFVSVAFQCSRYGMGIVSGLVLALLASRLASKIIDPTYWVVIALFLYPMIQSGYVHWDVDTIKILLAAAALACKVVMFLFVSFCLQEGRIAEYMHRLPLIEAESRRGTARQLMP